MSNKKTMCIRDMGSETGKFETVLVVKAVEERSFASKPGNFLWFLLADRTGEMEGKMWEPPPGLARDLAPGVPVRVEGSVSKWRDAFQIIVRSMHTLEPSSVNPDDFLPSAAKSSDDMWTELTSLFEHVDDADYLGLLETFSRDHELRGRFCRAPGSVSWHHAYLGGLLEHTLSVTKTSLSVAASYPRINKSLLVAGAVFHDIGKIDDYRCDTVIDYTDSGRFIGHIVSGYARFQDICGRLPGFPAAKALAVGHIIVSHHRKEEWGAPQRPKTIEAQLVHYADNLDAQVNGCDRVIEEALGQGLEWSRFSRLLETSLFCGSSNGGSGEKS